MTTAGKETHHTVAELFENNRRCARATTARDPEFFASLARQQHPDYLWIGCADSRVPANEILGMLPGEVFVHRNVANVVVHTDLNCLAVMQYAVEVLKVRHIIVTGHYGCGGVRAAVDNARLGLIDNWLRHVQAVHQQHREALAPFDAQRQHDLMCELNVLEQVLNVGQTTVVQDAWARGQPITLHGFVYSIHDGLLRDLKVSASGPEQLQGLYRAALRRLGEEGRVADGG